MVSFLPSLSFHHRRNLYALSAFCFFGIVPSWGQVSGGNPANPGSGLRQVGQLNQTIPVYGTQVFDVEPNYKTGEAWAVKLRSDPKQKYSFDRASLRDVFRFLAEEAGIPYISMIERASSVEGAPVNALDSLLITFTMRASPFVVLEAIAKANDIALVYEKGIWIVRPINEKEMIGRTYKLKFTTQDKVKFDSAAGGGAGGVATTSSSQGTSVSIPNLNRQQDQNIYKNEEPPVVKELKSMLNVKSSGHEGKVARAEASVGNFPNLPNNEGIRPDWANAANAGATSEATVTFNSDTNSIYVVATRQQHQWVEGFLVAADQPQALIGIEVKFFETTKDPKKDMGLDWAGTLGTGFTVKATDMLASPTGAITLDQTATNDSLSGVLPAGSTPYNSTARNKQYQATVAMPYSAVLSASQLAVTVKAFMSEQDTSIVQYPRVLTVNNREVAISNAVNEPILGSSSNNQAGGSSTTTNNIAYLPIGTQLNILPKTMPDGSVFLSLSITVSSRVSSKPINTGTGTNDYPVTSSRVYQSALQVESGYTLAVGGLDEATDAMNRNGIPYLQNIPGIGELFKSKGRAQNKKNLIIFITPTVIHNRKATSGISEHPESTLPMRPGSEPRPPAFTPDGKLVGGIDGLQEAIRWLEWQLQYYKQLDKESRVDKKSQARIRGIMNTAMMIQSLIPGYAKQHPDKGEFLASSEDTIEQLIKDLSRIRSQSNKKIIY